MAQHRRCLFAAEDMSEVSLVAISTLLLMSQIHTMLCYFFSHTLVVRIYINYYIALVVVWGAYNGNVSDSNSDSQQQFRTSVDGFQKLSSLFSTSLMYISFFLLLIFIFVNLALTHFRLVASITVRNGCLESKFL